MAEYKGAFVASHNSNLKHEDLRSGQLRRSEGALSEFENPQFKKVVLDALSVTEREELYKSWYPTVMVSKKVDLTDLKNVKNVLFS